MTEVYLGEVRMFAGNFAPRSNALANGQLLSISQNSALFSLYGTTYGGDGVQTFGIPDLRGRVPLSAGSGPGLSTYVLGQRSGTESVTLSQTQMPAHSHNMFVSNSPSTTASPSGQVPATLDASFVGFYFGSNKFTGQTSQLAGGAISIAGGSLPHENRIPTLAINYIVALQGVFPSRN